MRTTRRTVLSGMLGLPLASACAVTPVSSKVYIDDLTFTLKCPQTMTAAEINKQIVEQFDLTGEAAWHLLDRREPITLEQIHNVDKKRR